MTLAPKNEGVEALERSNRCVKCGVPWGMTTGKEPCPKGGQCDIPAARATRSAASKTVRPPKPDLEQRILRYLSKYPEGLTNALLRAWIDSCRKGGGYTQKETDEVIRRLRDEGRIICTSGLWWLRKK